MFRICLKDADQPANWVVYADGFETEIEALAWFLEEEPTAILVKDLLTTIQWGDNCVALVTEN